MQAIQFAADLHTTDMYLLASHTGASGVSEDFKTFGIFGDPGTAFVERNASMGRGTSVLLARVKGPISGRPFSPRHDIHDCPYVAVATSPDKIEGLPEPSALIEAGREVFAIWRLSKPVSAQRAVELGKALAARCNGREAGFVPLPGTIRNGAIVQRKYHKKSLRHDPDRLGQAESDYGQITLTRADQIKTPPTTWIWDGMIAAGMMVICMGPAKMGKSTIVMDFAARITRGRPWPDGMRGCAPGSVVFFENEDAEVDTRSRAEVAGADMTRLLIQKPICDFSAVENVTKLERILDGLDNPRLIVLSPIVQFFGANCRGETVRTKLIPMLEMIERRGIALIGVGHVTAGKAGKSAEEASGPQVFVRRARNVLSVSIDQTDPAYKTNPKKARRKMTCAGGNNTRDDFEMPYRIEGARTADGSMSSRIAWLEAGTERDDTERLALPKPMMPVQDWIRARLSDGRVHLASVIEKAALEAGYSRTVLYRGKADVNVSHGRQGFQGPATWRLAG